VKVLGTECLTLIEDIETIWSFTAFPYSVGSIVFHCMFLCFCLILYVTYFFVMFMYFYCYIYSVLGIVIHCVVLCIFSV